MSAGVYMGSSSRESDTLSMKNDIFWRITVIIYDVDYRCNGRCPNSDVITGGMLFSRRHRLLPRNMNTLACNIVLVPKLRFKVKKSNNILLTRCSH